MHEYTHAACIIKTYQLYFKVLAFKHSVLLKTSDKAKLAESLNYINN